MATLKELQKKYDLLKKEVSIQEHLIQNDKKHGEPTKKKIRDLTKEILELEEKITAEKKKQGDEAKRQKALNNEKRKTLSFEKQLIKLGKTSAGEILNRIGLTQDLEDYNKEAQKAREAGAVKSAKAYNIATAIKLKAIDDLKNGLFKEGNIVNDLETELEELGPEGAAVFKELKDSFEDFDKVIIKGGDDLEEALTIDAKDLDGLEDMRKSLKKFSAIASSPELMGALAIGLVVKLFTDLASQANEVRQQLGLSVGESAQLGTKVSILSKGFSLLGGDGQQLLEFVKGINTEFGSINELSFKTLTNFGLLQLRTGLTGDSAAKLAKSIQNIQGGSLETSLNMISTFESMSRTAGVAPKAILEDIAQNTEMFAKFAKDGGKNIAKAALSAKKLGLELSAVDKIAESLLDFESSIEAQMEAQVLLGRQINLDKARELALSGNLEGVLEEVKRQVGGAAEFAKLNVVQRKALAASVGLEVSEMNKLVNQHNLAAKAQEKQIEGATMLGVGIGAIAGLAAAIVPSIIGSIPFLQGLGFRQLGKGLMVGAAGALGGGVIGGLVGNQIGKAVAPKLETGGFVKESGMAEVHRGEVFSGTNNEMGFGADMTETNKLLKRLISSSESGTNKLSGKLGDLALRN